MLIRNLMFIWIQWKYRKHNNIGHPDSHEGCETCAKLVSKLWRLDWPLAKAKVIKM